MIYKDLQLGQTFIFNYPHHGEVVALKLYRKAEGYYEEVESGDKHTILPATDHMPVILIV